jgi:hypothetical protein
MLKIEVNTKDLTRETAKLALIQCLKRIYKIDIHQEYQEYIFRLREQDVFNDTYGRKLRNYLNFGGYTAAFKLDKFDFFSKGEILDIIVELRNRHRFDDFFLNALSVYIDETLSIVISGDLPHLKIVRMGLLAGLNLYGEDNQIDPSEIKFLMHCISAWENNIRWAVEYQFLLLKTGIICNPEEMDDAQEGSNNGASSEAKRVFQPVKIVVKTDVNADLGVVWDNLILPVYEQSIAALITVLKRAQKEPPESANEKRQFINKINRLLELYSLRIETGDGELVLLKFNAGGNGKGYIGMTGRHGVPLGSFSESQLKISRVREIYESSARKIVLDIQ